MENFHIPKEILFVINTLKNANFEGYLVGGCVRDLIMGKTPNDWDVTTNATPPEIEGLFPKTFYNNSFGTVTVVNEEAQEGSVKEVQITPYRTESTYSDKRHPDSVTFSDSLSEDLKRRDFTMNALAYDPSDYTLVDSYKGQNDIKDKIIRSVGDPHERLSEDALRILRAIRFSAQLGFDISRETKEALKELAPSIQDIAIERITDEFSKIIMSDEPRKGLELMEEVGILQYIIPELREGINIDQNQAHSYHVFEHNLRCLQHAAKRGFPFHVRLSALFHDVAKPATRKWGEKNNDWTFYGHDVVGGRMTKKIMSRMRFSRETTDLVAKLVRWHLFFSDPDQVTMSAVRRLIRNVGQDHIWDLMNVRVCDRIGTGRPKEEPYRLRKYESMIEEALRQPVSVTMMKIDGDVLMKKLNMKPGPIIGLLLHALLEEVLDDPEKNTEEYLEKRALELSKLPEKELRGLADKGKERKDMVEEEASQEIRKKYWVK